jgi:hypothetical protein
MKARFTGGWPAVARGRAAVAGTLMAVVLVSTRLVPVRADTTSDIPGIPLPGPVATGQLGGPIYDVVYRVVVPPGSVILADLSGTPGTDFDLYLFDATATTVLSTQGLLAQSIGPTSSESISWATRTGGTFYLDLNGATDVEGTYELVVQIVPDQTPPAVSIRLGAGRSVIGSLSIPVQLQAWDDLSAVTDMAISEDGQAFGPWLPFSSTWVWQAPPGDGLKTLWVKVRNAAGLESPVAQASIRVDTTPPAVLTIDPEPGSRVANLRPPLRVRFNEPIDPGTWNHYGLLVQARDGSLVPGEFTWDPLSLTGTFVPDQDLEPGAAYVVTVGPVTDLAGNRVAPVGSWIIVPVYPTRLTVEAMPRVLTFGQQTRVVVRAWGLPPGASIVLEIRPGGASDFAVADQLVPEPGQTALIAYPSASVEYRVRYPGSLTTAATEGTVRVLVRRAVALAGWSSTVANQAWAGRAVALVASVRPALPAVAVSFHVERWDPTRHTYREVTAVARTSREGRAAWRWVPGAPGRYRIRVTTPPTAQYANGYSAWYPWLIR